MARRPYQMRRPGHYPLLVSGNGVREHLSAADCELIAVAINLANEHYGSGSSTAMYQRGCALVKIFRRGENV